MYYIHVNDPHFEDPPWPGQRRLGPYETKAEANLQASHDKDMGVDIEGIYTEKQSEDMRGEDASA